MEKTARQIERHFKGIANHWRIEILWLLSRETHLGLEEIADKLHGNIKTISEHTNKMVKAGLLNKQYQGQKVLHSLSPYGKIFNNFTKTF